MHRALLCFFACFLLVVSAAERAGALGAPLLPEPVKSYHFNLRSSMRVLWVGESG